MDNPAHFRKTVRLSGYVNVFSVEDRPPREATNALGYTYHHAPCWKFFVKLTQAGFDPRSQYGHYGLNFVTSSESQAVEVTERLERLRDERTTLTFDAPVSFVNWTNRSTHRLTCGAVLGLPLEVIFAEEHPAPSTEELDTSAERLTVPLRGTIELFSVETRFGRASATPRGYVHRSSTKGWRVNVLLREEGCSPEGTIGRHGMNFYTDDKRELDFLQRSLSYLQETKEVVDLIAPVNYYEWLDKGSGAFRCGSSLDLPFDLVDYYPEG